MSKWEQILIRFEKGSVRDMTALKNFMKVSRLYGNNRKAFVHLIEKLIRSDKKGRSND